MQKVLTSLILTLFFLGAYSQSHKKQATMKVVKSIPANATVLGLLEGSKNLAVLRIDKVESNDLNLKKGSEILVEFYFSTQPVKNSEKLKGIRPNDEISMRLTGEYNEKTAQFDYMALNYVVGSRATAPATD
jgi:predicted transcriptional regulator